MSDVQRTMKCCGGPVADDEGQHAPDCPSIVRAALSWIEESSIGEQHRQRGLAAFEAILSERDEFRRLHGECTCADQLCPAHGDDPFTAIADEDEGTKEAPGAITNAANPGYTSGQ